MKIKGISQFLFNYGIFVLFSGFYFFVLVFKQISGSVNTDVFSFILRLSALLSIFTVYWLDGIKLKRRGWVLVFCLFFAIYLFRIILDYAMGRYFYMDYPIVIVQSIIYCLIPFLLPVLIGIDKLLERRTYKTILLSSFLFFVVVIVSFGSDIGRVVRIDRESEFSGQLLSYSSGLVLATIPFYIMHNKTNLKFRAFGFFVFLLALPVFTLGNTRGSLVATGIVYFVGIFYSLSVKNSIRIGSFVIIAILLIYGNYELLEKTILSRTKDISVSEDNIRISIWNQSFAQWVEHPFFGDKLQVEGWRNYPHNLLLEVLQSIGILGFSFLAFLLLKGFRTILLIFSKDKPSMWIANFFLITFIQAMFSGAIYTNGWLWLSVGIIIAYSYGKDFVPVLSNRKG